MKGTLLLSSPLYSPPCGCSCLSGALRQAATRNEPPPPALPQPPPARPPHWLSLSTPDAGTLQVSLQTGETKNEPPTPHTRYPLQAPDAAVALRFSRPCTNKTNHQPAAIPPTADHRSRPSPVVQAGIICTVVDLCCYQCRQSHVAMVEVLVVKRSGAEHSGPTPGRLRSVTVTVFPTWLTKLSVAVAEGRLP